MLTHIASYGQERISREEYIKLWSAVAVLEMEKYGIPASIKLAQALLESDDGNSYLAIEGNNHFGIKCHSGWKGPEIHKDDDARNECFRKYAHAEESFRDHSLFLSQRERYAGLFSLEPTDYRSWAKGLKQAGYATNPRYAEMLIRIIEKNELHRLDYSGRHYTQVVKDTEKTAVAVAGDVSSQNRSRINDVKVVFAVKSDTYRAISDRAGLTEWMLRRFNEVGKNEEPLPGSPVYLQPKRNRCPELEHTSPGGETLWDVSMRYGIKVKRLEKLNHLDRTAELLKGHKVILR